MKHFLTVGFVGLMGALAAAAVAPKVYANVLGICVIWAAVSFAFAIPYGALVFGVRIWRIVRKASHAPEPQSAVAISPPKPGPYRFLTPEG